jgi:copper chaperone CopZ
LKRPRPRLLKCVLAISAFPAAASAELLRVEQSYGGIECASCVDSIAKGIKRVRGVESAEVNPGKNVVVVHLAAGNRVKLEAIRDAIKATGFTPGEAAIEARGKLDDKQFVVEGTRQVFATQSEKVTEGVATVTGEVPASGPGEPLRLNIRALKSARAPGAP